MKKGKLQQNIIGNSINHKRRRKMKNKNILILGTALLMTAPAFSATPDKTDDGTKQTLTVNQEKVDRTVSEIRIDGNNAVLLFTDSTTLTADMRLVTLTMSYDEGTNVSRLHVTDKDGNVKIYDLQGRKIVNSKWSNSKLQNGIYVVNGKKVTNKKK